MKPTAKAAAVTLVAALSAASALHGQEAPFLPDTIPLFPLPDVALFPSTTAPFHIFEPRYREMVADALAGDSIIGMVLLQPGYEEEYEGRPPIYATGCAGVIVSSELLPDGRYNIALRGVTRFRVLLEDDRLTYRLARVELIPDAVSAGDRDVLSRRRQQIEDAFLATIPRAQRPPAGLSDEEVVDGLSLVLPMSPERRMELLEADGPLERAERLLAVLRGARAAAR